MSRQFPWLSDPNWNTSLDTGVGVSPSIQKLIEFRLRGSGGLFGPGIVLDNNPVLAVAFAPYLGHTGPVFRMRTGPYGNRVETDVYNTVGSGEYKTISGWQEPYAGTKHLVKWYNQGSGADLVNTTVDGTGDYTKLPPLYNDNKGWYCDGEEANYMYTEDDTALSSRTYFSTLLSIKTSTDSTNTEQTIFGEGSSGGGPAIFIQNSGNDIGALKVHPTNYKPCEVWQNSVHLGVSQIFNNFTYRPDDYLLSMIGQSDNYPITHVMHGSYNIQGAIRERYFSGAARNFVTYSTELSSALTQEIRDGIMNQYSLT